MERGWVASVLLAVVIGLGAWLNVSEGRAAPDGLAVRLCYENVDVRPWQYRQGGGLDFQVLERAGKKVRLGIEYEAQSWQTCLARLDSGQVDGVFRTKSIAADRRADDARGNKPGVTILLHADDESAGYLVLSPEFIRRSPEVAGRFRQAVDAVHASAAYQNLERQTITMLGRT